MVTLGLVCLAGSPGVTGVTRSISMSQVFLSLRAHNGTRHRTGVSAMVSRGDVSSIGGLDTILSEARLLIEMGSFCSNSHRRVGHMVSSNTSVIVLPCFGATRRMGNFVSYIKGETEAYLLIRAPRTTRRLSRVLSIRNVSRIRVKLGSLRLNCGVSFVFRLITSNAIRELYHGLHRENVFCNFNNINEIRDRIVLPTRCVVNRRCELNSNVIVLSETFYSTSGLHRSRVFSEFGVNIGRFHRCRKIIRGVDSSRLTRGRRGLITYIGSVIRTGGTYGD